jgi:hypothetical protein
VKVQVVKVRVARAARGRVPRALAREPYRVGPPLLVQSPPHLRRGARPLSRAAGAAGGGGRGAGLGARERAEAGRGVSD